MNDLSDVFHYNNEGAKFGALKARIAIYGDQCLLVLHVRTISIHTRYLTRTKDQELDSKLRSAPPILSKM